MGVKPLNQYEVKEVPISLLSPHPKRGLYKTIPDKDSGFYLLLLESIRSEGIRDPIKVQLSSNTIFSGNTRFEVATDLQHENVPVVYYDVTDDEAEDLLVQENIERAGDEKDLIRLAHSLKRMQDIEGRKRGRPKDGDEKDAKTPSEIADKFGIRRSTFYNTLKLLELVPPLQKLVSEQKIGLLAGVALASLTKEQQHAFFESIKEDAEKTGYTVTERSAKFYKQTLQPREDEEANNPGQPLVIDGEMDISFNNSTSQDEEDSGVKAASTSPISTTLFGDETTELMSQVDGQFQTTEGLPAVPVNKARQVEVEKIGNIFTDTKRKATYKRAMAKNELNRAKQTLFRLESDLPAMFSADLFEDEDTELPSEIEQVRAILERFSAKLEALKKQFA